MALSTNLISGLSSGFDWRTMIDQLMQIERRPLNLVENQKTDYESKLELFQEINTKLLSFKTQAGILASSDAFNVFTSNLSTDSATYSASEFLSVSTGTTAMPGSHTITMNANSSLAQTRKISSQSFSTFDTALNRSGEFVMNGRAVNVETSDDLTDIRDKINNLNTGENATGVTASILTVSTSNYRLVLTSDNTGEDAFTIFDASADTVNILSNGSTGLGFTDGTSSIKNYISNGVQSEAFSNSTQAVGSMLGLNTAQNGTVTIGAAADPNQFTVSIDLSKSLTDIAGDINTAATAEGSNVTASVASTTLDGETTYRLKIENTTSFTDDENVLETLGILEEGQSSVAEVHLSDTANNKVGGGNIQATDTIGQIDTGGDANNVNADDTVTIIGTKHDGSTVSTTFDPADLTTATLENLLDQIESDFGLSAGSAIITNGKIQVTDSTAGDSLLSISLVANNEGGGTLDLGTMTASTEGYVMQLQAGQDANVIINGTAITSATNIIDDAVAGVTFNLLTVESGSTVTVNISRDNDTIKSSVQDLLDEYNGVMTDINEQFAYDEESETGGLLQGDGTLHSIKSDLVNTVVGAITGLSSSMNALSLMGITSDNDGQLSIDDDDFIAALNDNFNNARRVFVAEGSTTDGDVLYVAHAHETVAGDYEVNITQAADQAQATGTAVLTSGIGAANIETLTITQGSKVAAITLNGASGENGSSIDNIVNAVNSEFDSEYAQSIMGNIKNTTDAAETTAIASTTTWNNVYSGGVAAGLSDDEIITFTGHKKNGIEVNGSYTISDITTDTVQGLLSAVESAYNNEVSAAINTYGYLVITDKTTGNSNLDITITEPATSSLDFGDVTTSNLLGSVRNTKDSGVNAIEAGDTWSDLDGHTLADLDVIKFSGYKANGEAVEGSYTVNLADTLSVFLSAIDTAYGGDVTASIQDGRMVLTDGTANTTLGIEIFEPSGKGVDFGTLSGGESGRYAVSVTASKDGSDHLVLTHDEYGSSHSYTIQVSGSDLGLTDNETNSGIDVMGTINGEAATGSGQLLTGDAPESEETTSIEGLTIKYSGTTSGDQGKVKITMGVAELFDRSLYDITNVSNGYLDYKIESVTNRIDDFEEQIENMEARLERKMERLINRFVAMELALSQIQSQSQWLSGQVSSISSGWGN